MPCAIYMLLTSMRRYVYFLSKGFLSVSYVRT